MSSLPRLLSAASGDPKIYVRMLQCAHCTWTVRSATGRKRREKANPACLPLISCMHVAPTVPHYAKNGTPVGTWTFNKCLHCVRGCLFGVGGQPRRGGVRLRPDLGVSLGWALGKYPPMQQLVGVYFHQQNLASREAHRRRPFGIGLFVTLRVRSRARCRVRS